MRLRYILLLISLLFVAAFSVSVAQDETTEPAPTPTPSPTEPAIITPDEPPEPSASVTQDGITLEKLFDTLQQGRVGVLHVYGPDLAGARLRFMNRVTEFFPVEGDGYYGLLAVGMDTRAARTYNFTVMAYRTDGTSVSLDGEVDVRLGGFIQQDIDVPKERGYLVDPAVERSEFARMDTILNDVTEEKLWDGEGFQLPINADLTSPFGAYRVFNETTEARHTGWDIRASIGTPVRAMGSGRVAFAGVLDIRGNHVIIDHGYGIYSGYSHFSQTHVTRGQTVERGQIIGVTGNSGRSSGPHLHWEMTVNGKWIDSVDFLNMWMPG